MRFFSAYMILIALSGCASPLSLMPGTPSSPPEDEDYSVYSAVIESLFIEEGVEQFVIHDHTSWDVFKRVPPSEHIQSLGEGWPSLRSETRMDYQRKNQGVYLLENRFNLPKPSRLITETDLKVIFHSSVGWYEFFEKFPNAQGILTLSRVGFSPDRQQAMVYVGNEKGWIYGLGRYVLLSKNPGPRWRVVSALTAWENH